MARKILIVEDDSSINHMLQTLLNEEGYETRQAFSGTEALLRLSLEPFDLILLDLMLPGKTGESVFSEVRAVTPIPIIILTAKSEINDKVRLLKQGVDDYITKPFNNAELLARIEAVLRRSGGGIYAPADEQILRCGPLQLSLEEMTASMHGKPLGLTRSEFDILRLLMSKPGKVFTKNQIFESVWGYEYMGEENALNTHISNLRKKLARRSPDEWIETVWGLGFKLNHKEG